jgi:hypothetical protein
MANLEIFSWRKERLTVGEVKKIMRARGWEIRCVREATKDDPSGSNIRVGYFLLQNEEQLPIGQPTVYGWHMSYRRAKQLARDFPETTHYVLGFLESYDVPLAKAFIYHKPIDPRSERDIVLRGQKYLDGWKRAHWRISLSEMRHAIYVNLNGEFCHDLSHALLETGHGLHDDLLKGEFIIRTAQGANTFNTLDPDAERRGLEPDAQSDDGSDYMAEVRAYYAKFLEPYYGHPEGASKQEVDTFEQKIGLRLPLAYKQFLRWAGVKAKGMGLERSMTELKWICRQNSDFDWHLKHRVQSSWGGAGRLSFFIDGEAEIEAWFILPKESDNPPIYYVYDYDEDTGCGTRKVFDSFSGFILNQLESSYKGALSYRHPKL